DMYANFESVKNDYLSSINAVALNASTYVKDSANYVKANSSAEIDRLFTEFDNHCMTYIEETGTLVDYNLLLKGINSSLQELKTAIDLGLNHSINKTGYYMLSTEANRTELYQLINKIASNFTSPASHKIAGENYYNTYRKPFHDCLENLIFPDINDVASKYVKDGTYHVIITLRMNEIAFKMQEINKKATADSIIDFADSSKQELNKLFNRFVNCSLIFEKSYKSSVCVDALYSVKSKYQRSNLVGYSDVSLYEQEEISSEYQYYIEKHSNPDDFANSLSVTHTSNKKANAYDFSFFIVSLFTIVVIIFAIYLSAHTISGEINNNSMRFTALRPVKRGSIFFGKYLSIIIMSSILLLFATITSFIVGGIVFGFESANILTIINSDTVIVMHPMAMLGIFVLSQILVVAVYSAISIMISALLKSDLLTMVISAVIYIANLILPLFFGASSWLRFNPLVNLNLYSYFGTTGQANSSILSKLFNSVVYHGMSLWISIAYVVGITAIVLAIGKTMFKRKEL
ncbi:MAG: ABC transporter permease subunit, partial [Clostridia bacterium]|nr:ABC transporter permease subunit [Clostridia bacterium]